MVHIDSGKQWSDVRTKLRAQLSKDEYESWFTGLQFVSFSDWMAPVLTVSVAMPFLKHWIRKNYLELLQATVSEVYGPIDEIIIKVRTVSPHLPAAPKSLIPSVQGEPRLGHAHPHVSHTMLPGPKFEPVPKRQVDSLEMQLTPEEIAEMAKRKDRGILIEDIQRSVCRHFGIHETDLKSHSLQRLHREARNVGMYLSYKLTKIPLKTIGKHFGNRDDSTVLHAKRETAQQIKIDDPHKTSVIILTRELMKLN